VLVDSNGLLNKILARRENNFYIMGLKLVILFCKFQ
jgi:hypothetical protein